MFEKEILEKIQCEFKVNEKSLPVYYEEAEQEAKLPYIVQYRLDIADISLTQDDINWELFVQFSIFGLDSTQTAFISQELIKFLKKLTETENYTIIQNKKYSSRNIDNGVSCSTISREFIYEKKGGI